jgi:glucose dehydrogenase
MRVAVGIAIMLAALFSACGGADSPATPTASTFSAAGFPPEVTSSRADWPLPGQDYRNSRAAVESTIRASNVAQLAPAWQANVTGGLTTVPIVVGSTVYVQDRMGLVEAVDLSTGQVLWTGGTSAFNPGPNGVAVGWGKLFGVSTNGVFALDAATGRSLWTTKLAKSATEGIDIQPTVFDGKVIVSTVPISVAGQYHGGDRGVVYALNAETGEVAWQFDTVNSADIWGNLEVNAGGGAWYPPSIDPAQGLVYIGTGNPAPFPGTSTYPNGSSRPGPNLYTDSVLALDVRTGALRWYHQAYPHDLFDRDLVHTMLVDLPANGGGGRVLVSTGKGGDVFGLDPSTGTLRWNTPVGLHHNDDLASLPGPTEILPGTFGGVLTPPAAADGIVYVATLNAPQVLAPNKTDYFGAKIGAMSGEVIAIDARDGKAIWDTKIPGDPTGGTTVVNDLVLTATAQGAVVAMDRATGAIVWQVQEPGGIIGWMTVVGSTILVPVGNAKPPQLVALRIPPG